MIEAATTTRTIAPIKTSGALRRNFIESPLVGKDMIEPRTELLD